jgi:predicted RNA binding protein YcfA (HicA-like mRNA interferase family)
MSRLPALKPREVVSALKRAGFIEQHQRGSHLFLWNPVSRKVTSVPIHSKDLKRPTLKGIIKQAGLSEDEFISRL